MNDRKKCLISGMTHDSIPLGEEERVDGESEGKKKIRKRKSERERERVCVCV